jgi:hypothetical protein
MAVLQIQAAPFFASKNRAFWNLQLAGWGAAFLLRGVSALANQQPLDLLALILVTTITGFSISLILSVIYRQLIRQTPLVTWGVTALVLFVAVVLHASIDAWVQGVYYAAARDTTFAQRVIGLLYLPLTLLGGWSALYYAINFFLTVGHAALSAQSALPVQHPEFDQHAGAAETDRACQCDADAAVRLPASHPYRRTRQSGDIGAGDRDAAALSRYRTDAV